MKSIRKYLKENNIYSLIQSKIWYDISEFINKWINLREGESWS